MKKTFWIFLFFAFLPISIYAQIENSVAVEDTIKVKDKNVYSSLKEFDFFNLEIPPLEILLENARNSTASKGYAFQVGQAKSELYSERRSWMNYIKLYSAYQYGTMSNLSFIYSPDSGAYIGERQSIWNVGVSFTMPIEEIFNGHNKVKKRQLRVKELESNYDTWYDEYSMEIIRQYVSAIECLELLKINMEALTVADAQYKVSENDFINGKITIQGLSVQKNIQRDAITQYNQLKSSLLKSILLLEVMTQTKILSK
ncbi:MAG: TolC family protein [Bacteroidales bacterium]|jgi:outer membrane protein TolC